jgi:hypothetical protein
MGEARTNWKVRITVALITGLSVIVAAAIPGVIPHVLRWLDGDHPNKYVNGVVSDALTRAPMPGVVVRLETNEGKLLTQDTTDHDGKFNLPIQGDMEVMEFSHRQTVTRLTSKNYQRKRRAMTYNSRAKGLVAGFQTASHWTAQLESLLAN